MIANQPSFCELSSATSGHEYNDALVIYHANNDITLAKTICFREEEVAKEIDKLLALYRPIARSERLKKSSDAQKKFDADCSLPPPVRFVRANRTKNH
jgi:hypothetical protein